jgi:hypothetical protein
MKVTLHNHHIPLTPSKQRSRIHALTGQYLRYVRSASFLWWMQQYKYGPHFIRKIITVNMSLGTPYMHKGSGGIVPPIFILGPRLGLSAARTGRLIVEQRSSILPLNRRFVFIHFAILWMSMNLSGENRPGSEAE